MTIGTFGTFGQTTTFVKDRNKKKRKGKRAPANRVDGDRFKCSRCTVKTDNEDVIISHIISANDCKAGYYTDKELSK
jgi:hypothetical protein